MLGLKTIVNQFKKKYTRHTRAKPEYDVIVTI